MANLADFTWTRRGMSIIWDIHSLLKFCQPSEIVSMRDFFRMSWPEDLPSNDGRTLIVAGLEGCLDILTLEDAERWLEHDLKSRILSFQDEYENQASLVFWIPGGKNRLQPNRANGSLVWRCSASQGGQSVSLGMKLWAGSETDVSRIISSENSDVDPDGAAWIGMHHPRIS